MKGIYSKNYKYNNEVLSNLLKNGLSTNEIVRNSSLKRFKDSLLEHLSSQFDESFFVSLEKPKAGSGFKIFLICSYSDMKLLGVEIKNHEISFINGDPGASLLDAEACFAFIGNVVLFWNDKKSMPIEKKKKDDDDDDTPDFEWL